MWTVAQVKKCVLLLLISALFFFIFMAATRLDTIGVNLVPVNPDFHPKKTPLSIANLLLPYFIGFSIIFDNMLFPHIKARASKKGRDRERGEWGSFDYHLLTMFFIALGAVFSLLLLLLLTYPANGTMLFITLYQAPSPKSTILKTALCPNNTLWDIFTIPQKRPCLHLTWASSAKQK